MLTPIKLGGFGMINCKELAESLDLRSYGRLVQTKHPFFSQVKTLLNHRNFFCVEVNGQVDSKLKESLRLLNSERLKILNWPVDTLISNTSFCGILGATPLKAILKPAGCRSLPYFVLNRVYPNPTVSQMDGANLRLLGNHLIYPELRRIISEYIGRAIRMAPVGIPVDQAYPIKNMSLVNISGVTSKNLRLNRTNDEDNIICLYKVGVALTPGEVLTWTKRIKKLTSTRHRNVILRVAHGDIFSNDRLFRFGLIDDPKCLNCPEPVETISHRLIECPKAREAWAKLEEFKDRVGLSSLTNTTLENILGANESTSKLELALQAELIHKLTSRNKIHCPVLLIKSVANVIANSEFLTKERHDTFKRVISEL